MRIQHNIMAMSAYRNYTNNVSAMKKNLERLSSGYKINRAGDDAAGLAISEKMRAQITGLETAQKNAKDGISLVQTAEGALTEVHDMLNRMVELATESANGTYDNTTDRAQLQKELDQLRAEIDRIADSSNFNGIQLLDGSLSSIGTLGAAENVDVVAVNDGDQSTMGSMSKGEYTFDLGDLKIAATAGDTITITIAGTAVVTMALTTGDVEDGMVKLSSVLAALASEAAFTVTDGTDSFVFNITVDTDTGLVTLKGDANPTKGEASMIAATAMTVNLTVTKGGNDEPDQNNGWDQAMHVVEAVHFADAGKLAQGKVDLTGKVVDGAQLIIGNEIYTFKVGRDGVGSGGNVIDLTDLEADDDKLLIEAAKRLSLQTNKHFDISADGVTGTIYLTEKAGKVDYKNDWDLYGTSAASDAEWKNLETGVGAVRLALPGETDGKFLTLQIGDTAASYNQLRVNIKDMHCASLSLNGINIATQDGAQAAIDVIKNAINQVSDVRGTLGATQNRLEHTINNLSVMTENIQDAESTIRDTDIAEEMMSYTKNNILIQSAQAMLAQANQIPQGVLQLLQ